MLSYIVILGKLSWEYMNCKLFDGSVGIDVWFTMGALSRFKISSLSQVMHVHVHVHCINKSAFVMS